MNSLFASLVAGFLGIAKGGLRSVREIVSVQKAWSSCPCHRLCLVVDTQFAIDIAGMDLDGVERKIETAGYFSIREPCGVLLQNLYSTAVFCPAVSSAIRSQFQAGQDDRLVALVSRHGCSRTGLQERFPTRWELEGCIENQRLDRRVIP